MVIKPTVIKWGLPESVDVKITHFCDMAVAINAKHKAQPPSLDLFIMER